MKDAFFAFLSHHTEDPFLLLLVLMVATWTTGRVFAHLRLPHVLGEIVAGIVLGTFLIDIKHSELLHAFAELGIFFLMFHSGLDTKLSDLVKGSRKGILIALASIVATTGISLLILQSFFQISSVAALLSSVVLASVSFPVVVRMLRHFQIRNTALGQKILCISLWAELLVFLFASVVVSLAKVGDFSAEMVWKILVETSFFLVGAYALGKFVLPGFTSFLNRRNKKAFTFALIVALFFGLFAEVIGLHVILGAYIAGIFVREELTNEALFQKVEDRFFGVSYSFLGPIFFASVGLHMSLEIFLQKPLEILLLTSGVVLGTFLGAGGVFFWLQKRKNAHAAMFLSVGLLGRGATGVVIASVGYDKGIFSDSFFSLLVALEVVLICVGPVLFQILATFIRPTPGKLGFEMISILRQKALEKFK